MTRYTSSPSPSPTRRAHHIRRHLWNGAVARCPGTYLRHSPHLTTTWTDWGAFMMSESLLSASTTHHIHHLGIIALSATMLFPWVCLLLGLLGLAAATEDRHTNNWAVLVCASRYWFNYRVSNKAVVYIADITAHGQHARHVPHDQAAGYSRLEHHSHACGRCRV